MNEIYIGTQETIGCMAQKYFGENYSCEIVSHNTKQYWCYEKNFGVRINISKDTSEAEQLKELLNKQSSEDLINDFLLNIFLKNISVSDFKEVLCTIKEEQYRCGLRAKQKELLSVLYN